MCSSARLRVLLLTTGLVAAGCTGPAASTFSISGVVTGVDGVAIRLTSSTAGTTTTVVTGVGGAYAFTGLAPGDYTLVPSLARYTFTPASRTVTVSDADRIDLRFEASAVPTPTYAISGVAGALPGVRLVITGPVDYSTWTVEGGHYSFPSLPSGTYQVTPSLAGAVYTPYFRPVVVADGDVGGVDFGEAPLVAGTHAIRGTTQGASFNFPVTLTGTAQAITGVDEGHFTFGFLADGTYTVTPASTSTLFVPYRRSVTVAGADVVLEPFLGLHLYPWDSFSDGFLVSTRWRGQERRVTLIERAAQLASSLRTTTAARSHNSTLAARSEARAGRITSAGAGVTLVSSTVDGIGESLATLDLRFQAPADQVTGPGDLTRALLLRAALVDRLGGPVAVWQAVECGDPACTAPVPVGAALPGATWPAGGAAIQRGIGYALSVSFDPATRVVSFGLSGGTLSAPLAGSLDLSATSTPFAADLSRANFRQVELSAISRAGGGPIGSASLTARFDDVAIGTDGAPSVLFDDFEAGTAFDPRRWNTGGEVVEVTGTPAALHIGLEQVDAPAAVAVDLRPLAAIPFVAVQAEASLARWSQAGAGQVGARLATTLYNDGSGGLGTGADVPGPGSQVGDVVAQLSMSASEVSCAVVRCNIADCSAATGSGLSFLMPWTPMGTVALGEVHALRVSWDESRHAVACQLDGRQPVTFDPVAAGAPVVAPPARPFWQLGASAGSAGPGADFSSGSSASVEAVFSKVEVVYGPVPFFP